MSQTLNPSDVTPGLANLVAPVKNELTKVEEILRSELTNDCPFVDELLKYGCLMGGKRLRPILSLLTAKALGEVKSEHLTLAAVVEMIHTATLIHDDILDEADQRRHLETVNSRWNNEASVLLGDYLFTHAFYLASTTGSAEACQIIGRATNTVCEGELRQVGSRQNFDLQEPEYLEIIEAKTAALCACACQMGSLFADADANADAHDDADAHDEIVTRFKNYGLYLGTAFQIADDLLDVSGEEEATGKSLGTDLEKQKPTLPLIRSLQLANEQQRAEMLELLCRTPKPTSQELLPWFETFDALNYSKNRAIEFSRMATEQLAGLPSNESLEMLKVIPQFVVARKN